MHVCTCISKGEGGREKESRAAAGSQKFSTMKTETIVYNEHENLKYQTLENKLPEMGCQFNSVLNTTLQKNYYLKIKKD